MVQNHWETYKKGWKYEESAFDFEAKWARNEILACKLKSRGMVVKLAHLEILAHHLSAFAWESSASQTLKDWRLERMIWAPESWAVLEQGRAVVEPKYRRSGMTIGSAGFVRSSYRDRTAFAGTTRKGLGKTWCCRFAEIRILVLADVRIAWNVFEADG